MANLFRNILKPASNTSMFVVCVCLLLANAMLAQSAIAKAVSEKDKKIAYDNLRKEFGKIKEKVDDANKRVLYARYVGHEAAYHMTLNSVYTIKNSTGVYKYISYAGKNESTSHADSGVYALYILKKQPNHSYSIVAKNKELISGFYGNPWGLDFAKLGKGFYGWTLESGSCRGGCYLTLAVYAPHKTTKKIVKVLDKYGDADKNQNLIYKIVPLKGSNIYGVKINNTMCRFNKIKWRYANKKNKSCVEEN